LGNVESIGECRLSSRLQSTLSTEPCSSIYPCYRAAGHVCGGRPLPLTDHQSLHSHVVLDSSTHACRPEFRPAFTVTTTDSPCHKFGHANSLCRSLHAQVLAKLLTQSQVVACYPMSPSAGVVHDCMSSDTLALSAG